MRIATQCPAPFVPLAVVLAEWNDADLPRITVLSKELSDYRLAWLITLKDGFPRKVSQLGPSTHPLTQEYVQTEAMRVFERELGGSVASGVGSHPLPSATVVVPTLVRRRELLTACVAGLKRLNYPDFNVVLVDNRPQVERDEDSIAFLHGLGVDVVHEPRRGISAARNRGVASSDSEIVAFTDDDVEVHPDWLLSIGRRFATNSSLACVTGLVLPRELETRAQLMFEQGGAWSGRSFQRRDFEFRAESNPFSLKVGVSGTGVGSAQAISVYDTGEFGKCGANMALRKAAIMAVGGFDAALGAGTLTHGGEDLAMFIRTLMAGGVLGYEPSAIVFHTHRRTLEELEQQTYGYGVGLSAMFCSILLADRRHATGLVGKTVSVMVNRKRAQQVAAANVPIDHAVKRRLGILRLRGLLAGPAAYWRSRRSLLVLPSPAVPWRADVAKGR